MALPDSSMISAKGTTLKAALAFIDSRWGQSGIDRVLAELDKETKELLTGLFLPSTRYPVQHLVNLCETIDRVHGRGDLNLCWDIGKYSGEFEIKLLHRVFLKMLSLQYWMKMAGATWRMYYSAGNLVPRMSELEGDITLSNFNPISKAFCYRFGGWVWRVVEISKHQNVQMKHTACVLDGAPACVWSGTWTS